VALTRFKRTLRRVRPAVRQLTHTLHLPPALSEIYGGPNAFWLRDVLESLPNLQSLIVSRLPFFDHHSLIALRYASSARRPSLESEEDRPQYDLKLLLAEREPNTTSAGLREALFHFPHLVYLDLSYTSSARDASVLAALANLWDLQVLKLRGVGMRDGEAEVLANAIGIRVRLLDLRGNLLTDMAVRSLMQACFLPPDRIPTSGNMNARQIEDWPVGMAPGPDFFSLDSLRSEELDRELLKQLTHPLTGRLAFEDIPHKGLTHLYIADNNLSVEGLSSLLKSTRLHILDGGSVDTVKTISRSKSLSSPTGYQDEVRFPGAEKLVPVLGTYASHSLTYLRVSHAVVSEAVQMKDTPSPVVSAAELSSEGAALVEVPAPAHYALELPSEHDAVFELSAEPAVPKSELPGDCIHFALSPPVNTAPDGNGAASTVARQAKTGDKAFAPEVAVNGTTEDSEEDVVLNASGSGLSLRTPLTAITSSNDNTHTTEMRHTTLDTPATASERVGHTPPSPSAFRLARIESLLRKRPLTSTSPSDITGTPQPVRSAYTSQVYTYLHPSHLPNLRTLVLTGVPTLVPESSPIIRALLHFISACADEAYLALLRAQTNYSLPPGHSRQIAELQHARSLFALKTIVLEMGTSTPSNMPVGKAWDHSRARFNMLKSSTGDRDSEALWSAAENDFSFFGEEGEEEDECGVYENEPEKYFPTASLDEKFSLDASDTQGRNNGPYSGVGTPDSVHVRSPSTLRPAMRRSPTMLQSPRDLPLGRNRRASSVASNKRKESMTSTPRATTPLPSEMPGTIPASFSQVMAPPTPQPKEEPLIDLVAELAKFRREKKKEYEDALLKWRTRNNPHNPYNGVHLNGAATTDEKDMPFVEGHWKGEIKIVRNAAPKGRTGTVDVYGNYFEKGYLYP
jgi:hypothetical protein